MNHQMRHVDEPWYFLRPTEPLAEAVDDIVQYLKTSVMCSRACWGFPSLPDILAEIDLIGALNTHIAVAQ